MNEKEFNELEKLVEDNVNIKNSIGQLLLEETKNENRLEHIFSTIINNGVYLKNYVGTIDFKMGVITVEKSNAEFNRTLDLLGFDYEIEHKNYEIRYILHKRSIDDKLQSISHKTGDDDG